MNGNRMMRRYQFWVVLDGLRYPLCRRGFPDAAEARLAAKLATVEVEIPVCDAQEHETEEDYLDCDECQLEVDQEEDAAFDEEES